MKADYWSVILRNVPLRVYPDLCSVSWTFAQRRLVFIFPYLCLSQEQRIKEKKGSQRVFTESQRAISAKVNLTTSMDQRSLKRNRKIDDIQIFLEKNIFKHQDSFYTSSNASSLTNFVEGSSFYRKFSWLPLFHQYTR